MKTIDVVLNTNYGGFEVSKEVYDELNLQWCGCGFLCGEDIREYPKFGVRSNPLLIKAIRKIGLERAAGDGSILDIVTIPDEPGYYISNHDGIEIIARSVRILERKFLMNNENRTYTMEEMEEANSDSPEVVREINMLSPNESTVFGGGAQPTIKITRII